MADRKEERLMKSLEKLTQLKELSLNNNPDPTKAQIGELKKALPKCNIYSNAPSCCPTIDASLGVGMVGGVKALILLLVVGQQGKDSTQA